MPKEAPFQYSNPLSEDNPKGFKDCLREFSLRRNAFPTDPFASPLVSPEVSDSSTNSRLHNLEDNPPVSPRSHTLTAQVKANQVLALQEGPNSQKGKRPKVYKVKRHEIRGWQLVLEDNVSLLDPACHLVAVKKDGRLGLRSGLAQGLLLRCSPQLELGFVRGSLESWEAWGLSGKSFSNCTLKHRRFKRELNVSVVTIGEVVDSIGNIRLTHDAVLAAEALAYPGPFIASSARKSAPIDEPQSLLSQQERYSNAMNGQQRKQADPKKRNAISKKSESEMDGENMGLKGAVKEMDQSSGKETRNGQKKVDRDMDALGSELQRRLEEHEMRHAGNSLAENRLSADGRESDGSDMAISGSDGQELVKDTLLEGPSERPISDAAESEMGEVGQARESMQDEDEAESRRAPENAEELQSLRDEVDDLSHKVKASQLERAQLVEQLERERERAEQLERGVEQLEWERRRVGQLEAEKQQLERADLLGQLERERQRVEQLEQDLAELRTRSTPSSAKRRLTFQEEQTSGPNRAERSEGDLADTVALLNGAHEIEHPKETATNAIARTSRLPTWLRALFGTTGIVLPWFVAFAVGVWLSRRNVQRRKQIRLG